MIIVKMTGGLGNQLFQYAFARSVSLHLKTEFKLDINPFSTYYKIRKYSLNHFNTKQQLTRDWDFFGFVWLIKQNKLFNIFYKYLRLKSKLMPFYYPQQTFHFDPRVFSKNGTYFDGFWVTEKYFKNIEPILRKELTLVKPFSKENQTMLKKIKETNAVSIHVRRYITSADKNFGATSELHGTCSIDYYKKAIEHIKQCENNPHFFIFSDNYEWAIKNLKHLPYKMTFLNSANKKDYEDLMLMASCKHNIIANSTFSWWGAWLNPNKNKIVIAPSKWFNNVKENVSTKDVIPESWIKI
jgi:hypothetical protein